MLRGLLGKEEAYYVSYIAILSPRQERYLGGWWLESNPLAGHIPKLLRKGPARKGRGWLCWTLGDMACQGARTRREEGLARGLLSDIRSGNPPLIYAPPGGR